MTTRPLPPRLPLREACTELAGSLATANISPPRLEPALDQRLLRGLMLPHNEPPHLQPTRLAGELGLGHAEAATDGPLDHSEYHPAGLARIEGAGH